MDKNSLRSYEFEEPIEARYFKLVAVESEDCCWNSDEVRPLSGMRLAVYGCPKGKEDINSCSNTITIATNSTHNFQKLFLTSNSLYELPFSNKCT